MQNRLTSLPAGSASKSERGTSRGRRSFIGVVSPIATAQFGVISHRQMVERGLDRTMIQRYLADGYLIQLYRGAYVVGHGVLSPRGRWLAATLASGSSAWLSHRSAAALWGLISPCLPVEVVRTAGGTPPTKILVHRTRSLPREQTCLVEGIPVTSVARTLVDLAGVVSWRVLQDAYSVARRLKLVDHPSILAALELAPNRKGAGRLRKLLAVHSKTLGWTRSELETRFLSLLYERGLPKPEVDVPIGERVVDFLWRENGLIGEADSVEFHFDRFTQDRSRDLEHLALGFETVRITDWMVENEPEDLARKLRKILSRSRR